MNLIMRHSTKFLWLLILILISGCGNNNENTSYKTSNEETVSQSSEQKNDITLERKLIKEGQIEFATNDLASTRKKILRATTKYKGYVSSDQALKSTERNSNTIIVRIPSDNFDNFLKEATSGIKNFDSKEINVKDVTEEFLDVQARLKTKKELEIRYLELLKQAKNVTEILEIEKQIGELRSSIESIEGRLNYLQSQISFSTLTLTFYESIPTQTEFGQKFSNGFIGGWENLIWFFVILTNIWPFIIIIIGLIFGIRIYSKNKAKKHQF